MIYKYLNLKQFLLNSESGSPERVQLTLAMIDGIVFLRISEILRTFGFQDRNIIKLNKQRYIDRPATDKEERHEEE